MENPTLHIQSKLVLEKSKSVREMIKEILLLIWLKNDSNTFTQSDISEVTHPKGYEAMGNRNENETCPGSS